MPYVCTCDALLAMLCGICRHPWFIVLLPLNMNVKPMNVRTDANSDGGNVDRDHTQPVPLSHFCSCIEGLVYHCQLYSVVRCKIDSIAGCKLRAILLSAFLALSRWISLFQMLGKCFSQAIEPKILELGRCSAVVLRLSSKCIALLQNWNKWVKLFRI